MTVSELIAHRQKFPQDAKVMVPDRWDTDEETELVRIEWSTRWNTVYLLEMERL